jgi:hypothetical protein
MQTILTHTQTGETAAFDLSQPDQLEQVADLMEVSGNELLWAIENNGKAETNTHTLVPCEDDTEEGTVTGRVARNEPQLQEERHAVEKRMKAIMAALGLDPLAGAALLLRCVDLGYDSQYDQGMIDAASHLIEGVVARVIDKAPHIDFTDLEKRVVEHTKADAEADAYARAVDKAGYGPWVVGYNVKGFWPEKEHMFEIDGPISAAWERVACLCDEGTAEFDEATFQGIFGGGDPDKVSENARKVNERRNAATVMRTVMVRPGTVEVDGFEFWVKEGERGE